MRKILIIVIFLISLPIVAGANEQKTEFTVLQWNIWQEGTMVPGGYDAIVDEIERLRPDFVTFSEVRNYHGTRFCDRIVASLRELATRYPSVKDFWFDGTWDASVKKNAWWTAHAEKMLKELVPGVTVNSRLRADDYGKRHFDSNGHLMGDYESGYERRLPDPVKDLQVTQWDWEACMTVPENQWGYHRDWSLSYVKTPAEVLERIIHAVAMGGNMAVNFGPQPDGEYVYMIVFNAPYSSLLTVKTPKDVSVESAVMIDGGRALEVIETARNEYNVRMPSADPGEPFVIRLETGGSAGSGNKYRDALI